MQDLPGSVAVDELAKTPSWEVLFENYVRLNKPVVMRGAMRDQPAFTLWTDEALKSALGGLRVDAETSKTETRGNPTQRMSLAELLGRMYRDELYAVIPLEREGAALEHVFVPQPLDCKQVWPQSLTAWLSSGGTSSVLHQDDAENFLMLLDGQKSVMLVHQDLASEVYSDIAEHPGTSPVHQDSVDMVNFPRFANVTWSHATLNPGDALYIPHSYWHQVNSAPGRNLALNMWWGHKQDFKWFSPYEKHKFDTTMFGREGWEFDKIKAQASGFKCRAPKESQRRKMSQVEFVDEDAFKAYLDRKARRSDRTRGEL